MFFQPSARIHREVEEINAFNLFPGGEYDNGDNPISTRFENNKHQNKTHLYNTNNNNNNNTDDDDQQNDDDQQEGDGRTERPVPSLEQIQAWSSQGDLFFFPPCKTKILCTFRYRRYRRLQSLKKEALCSKVQSMSN